MILSSHGGQSRQPPTANRHIENTETDHLRERERRHVCGRGSRLSTSPLDVDAIRRPEVEVCDTAGAQGSPKQRYTS